MNGQPNGTMTLIEDNEVSLGGVAPQQMSVGTAIQLAAATLDKRIVTARQYPRSISTFKKEACNLIREDPEVARSAEYAKPVGGGTVKGPSIRLLEIAATCWRNIEDGMVEAVVEDKSVRVTWFAYDLERNNRSEGYSSASIMGKAGRYPQHLIETTVAATASKARRNALEKVIPKAFIKDLLSFAKDVAAGNKEPLEVTRKKTLDFFARSFKVQPEQVFEFLGIAGVDDITEEHLDELRPVATALKDGEAKAEEFFAVKTESKLDAVRAKVAERKAEASAKPPVPAPTPIDQEKKETAHLTDAHPPEREDHRQFRGLMDDYVAAGGDEQAWLAEKNHRSVDKALEGSKPAIAKLIHQLAKAVDELKAKDGGNLPGMADQKTAPTH